MIQTGLYEYTVHSTVHICNTYNTALTGYRYFVYPESGHETTESGIKLFEAVEPHGRHPQAG